jgi:hypothetical protein
MHRATRTKSALEEGSLRGEDGQLRRVPIRTATPMPRPRVETM